MFGQKRLQYSNFIAVYLNVLCCFELYFKTLFEVHSAAVYSSEVQSLYCILTLVVLQIFSCIFV